MNINYLIYNPEAACGNGQYETEILEIVFDNTVLIDINKVHNYPMFFSGLDESDCVILCGGDGTLHRFLNNIENIEIKCNIYLYAVGVCNDFARNLGIRKGNVPDISINEYIKSLPVLTMQGRKREFINGIGYGLDDFYVASRDIYKQDKKIAKTWETIYWLRRFLFSYQPINMTVDCDGVLHRYERVWMAHTMNGKYLAGLKIAPWQCGVSKEKTLSLVVISGVGRLLALLTVLSVVREKEFHTRHGIEVLQGNKFKVEFDKPVTLWADGEKLPLQDGYEVKNR